MHEPCVSHDLENRSLLDLLALDQTLPRVEVGLTDFGKKIQAAHLQCDQSIQRAASQLLDLEISEHDLRMIVLARIARRMDDHRP